MKMSDAFPSRWLTASEPEDEDGNPVDFVMTIADVRMDELEIHGKDPVEKPVCYFEGNRQGSRSQQDQRQDDYRPIRKRYRCLDWPANRALLHRGQLPRNDDPVHSSAWQGAKEGQGPDAQGRAGSLDAKESGATGQEQRKRGCEASGRRRSRADCYTWFRPNPG